MSNTKKIKAEAKKYFKCLRRLDIGKEYIKLRTGMSKLTDSTRTALLDYIKIRCNHDPKFNNFILHLNKLIKTTADKVNNEQEHN